MLKNLIVRTATTARRSVTTWWPRFREGWTGGQREAAQAKARYVETVQFVAVVHPEILGPLQRRTLARANRATRSTR